MSKAKSGVFSDFVAPIGVLILICVVMTALLAATNGVTAPIIAETEAREAEEARVEVLPEADGFELLEVVGIPMSGTSATVTEAYKATNGVGYVFMITSNGYGGKNTLSMICSIDNDGNIVDTKVLSHSETAGLGSKVTGSAFRSQFVGKDVSLDGVDTISGATFSSTYYINAVKTAFAAYDLVKEGA
jgi:electron transport complex protein RnfG